MRTWSKWGLKNPRADSNVLVIRVGAKAMTDNPYSVILKGAKNIKTSGRVNVSQFRLEGPRPTTEENTPLV